MQGEESVEHGRKVCKARNPLCGQCVLCSLCPSCVRVGEQSDLRAG